MPDTCSGIQPKQVQTKHTVMRNFKLFFSLFFSLTLTLLIFSCGSDEGEPEEPMEVPCDAVAEMVFPTEGAHGLNILGTEGENITIDAGTELSLAANLGTNCQSLRVTFERQGGNINSIDWDFDISTVSNWFWDLNESTGIQTWTSRGTDLEANFRGFLPGTYEITTYINGSTTAYASIILNSEYENVELLNTFSSASFMFREGNDLYIGTNDQILKTDIADPSQTTTLVSGLSDIFNFTKHGDYLYISERTEVPGIDVKLSRVNVTEATPTVEFMLDGLTIGGMSARNNTLYMTDLRKSDVVSIDLTANSFSIVDLNLGGLETPINMTIDGDNIYISEESSTAKITRVDLSQASPQASILKSGLFFPDDMHVDGTTLYYSGAGSMHKLDLSQGNPQSQVVRKLSALTFTRGIDVYNGDFYFLEYPLNRLAKFDLD